MNRRCQLRLMAMGTILLVGCSGDDGPSPCDPVAAQPQPTKLGTVVAAGKHSDGTIYVIERSGDSNHRVFVSEAGTLIRRRVAGEGSGPASVVATVSETSPPLVIKAELANGKATRMAVVRGTIAGKEFEIGQEGDPLTVIGAEAVVKMPVRNLPGTVTIEYVADVQDGTRIVVTRPSDDWRYEDFKLFYGKPPSLSERKVYSVVRGSFTDISFDLDGHKAQAHFTSPLDSSTPFVKVGTETQSLASQASPSVSGLSFVCR